ncbi:phage terminase large subunit [bacterium]|nr:phage terminase large subunit [bacterium]
MKKKNNIEIPPKLRDFRNFLYLVWKHLNLPDPTPLQYDIAEYMQHGPKRSLIMAFRGVGKSWVCSAYVVHQLLLDPSKNILVVSASKNRSDDFSTFTLRIIQEIPLLQQLKPKDNQRFSKIAFDVGPAPAAHAPSVKSLGITSQLTGSRADIIVADDVEVPNNSATQGMRDKLDEQVKEFEAILKPLDTSRILFLGTPQCEDSIYNKLRERGYNARIWPSEYPNAKEAAYNYAGDLAPLIADEIDEDTVGTSTEPLRFTDLDLEERKMSYGRTGYALQFMLNPKLSDADRYPLKINDLIIMDVDVDLAPEKVVWSSDDDNTDRELPNVGLSGDRFRRPSNTVGDMIPYNGSVLSIDPSGRGKDETGYAVVKMLNGQLYVPDAGGIRGGYDVKTLNQLVAIAKDNKVNKVVIESNFGDGMFMELIKPLFRTTYPVTIEEVRHNKQKELRIVDTLEPVLNSHRLIIDPKVITYDYKSALSYPIEQQTRYMLFYQLSRITRDRGSLVHDDRLDALSIAVGYWTQQMASDVNQSMIDRQQELLQQELQDFTDSFHKTNNKAVANLWM